MRAYFYSFKLIKKYYFWCFLRKNPCFTGVISRNGHLIIKSIAAKWYTIRNSPAEIYAIGCSVPKYPAKNTALNTGLIQRNPSKYFINGSLSNRSENIMWNRYSFPVTGSVTLWVLFQRALLIAQYVGQNARFSNTLSCFIKKYLENIYL